MSDTIPKLLHDLREYLYNPFEPDNQSRLYHRVCAMAESLAGENPAKSPQNPATTEGG